MTSPSGESMLPVVPHCPAADRDMSPNGRAELDDRRCESTLLPSDVGVRGQSLVVDEDCLAAL
jgi:hypothetical protein